MTILYTPRAGRNGQGKARNSELRIKFSYAELAELDALVERYQATHRLEKQPTRTAIVRRALADFGAHYPAAKE